MNDADMARVKSRDINMARTFLLVLCLSLVPTGLLAQEANPYNGTWLGTYMTKKGAQRSAVLTLSDGGGTWKSHVRIKQDKCMGREMPVTIARATATDLALRVHGSKFLRGCDDYDAKFSRTGDNTLEGKIRKVGKLTLVRQ